MKPLLDLVAKWKAFEGKSSNPGDVEDVAFANGTEWGLLLAAHELAEQLGVREPWCVPDCPRQASAKSTDCTCGGVGHEILHLRKELAELRRGQ